MDRPDAPFGVFLKGGFLRGGLLGTFNGVGARLRYDGVVFLHRKLHGVIK